MLSWRQIIQLTKYYITRGYQIYWCDPERLAIEAVRWIDYNDPHINMGGYKTYISPEELINSENQWQSTIEAESLDEVILMIKLLEK